MKILSRIKKWWNVSPKKYNWKCGNCNKVFDGNAPELFIKHQTGEKHYDASKIPKTDCYISLELRKDVLLELLRIQKIMALDKVDDATLVTIINDTLAGAFHLGNTEK